MHRSKSLFKLDHPFLGTDGVLTGLRVAGRLKRSVLDINKIHLVILEEVVYMKL